MDDRLAYSRLMELIFEIRDAEEGGFYARALGQPSLRKPKHEKNSERRFRGNLAAF